MRRIVLGRATFFAACAGLVLAQVVAGCGSAATPTDATATGGSGAESGSTDSGAATGDSGSPGESGGASVAGFGGRGGAGSGGTAAAGGLGGSGGVNAGGGKGVVTGGTTGVGGGGRGGVPGSGAGGGGTTSVSGGAPSCIAGAPCNCKKLVGTVECTPDGASCSCPPAGECDAKADSPCFEPCGGEPFGAWVLEDACFGPSSGGSGKAGCETVIEGTPGKNDLRLRILDGGDMQLFGSEDWSISARVSLACLGVASVNSCTSATFWSEALLFSSAAPSTCTANACGVCDCAGDVHAELSSLFGFERWSRDGTNLQLGFITTPFCVTGDELWVGGSDAKGPKVSYKFKKQSCAGTPVPCASRTPEQCALGGSCWVGLCKATTGTVPRCATAFSSSECGVLQGCTWDPDGCAGTASDACAFENCDIEPGCTWGVPKERCGGTPFNCEERDVSQCPGNGCAVRPCTANFSDFGECQLLSAADCVKAPGCVVASGVCTGQALCTAQTDAAICGKLANCLAQPNCGGTLTDDCAALSVAACQSVLGCRLEW